MILGKLCWETMKLEAITKVIQPLTIRGATDREIENVFYDSRQVRPGGMFVVLRGRRREGSDFIEEAIRRGAVAVVSEQDDWARRDITHVRVEDARRALAEIACAFYNEPASRLQVAGITGTNGKTTTAFMLRDMLNAAGRPAGLVGTVWYELGSRRIPAVRTTPEAPDLQSMLDQMVRAGCRSAILEVSSHGLEQKRVWGIDFDVGVFTNLTRDHLDFHGTMDRYFAAKSLLFRGLGQMEKQASAVINLDDPWGQQLANINGLSARVITFGFHSAADVRAERVQLQSDGSTIWAATPWGSAPIRLRLLGRHNVSNALAALGAGGALGVDLDVMMRALEGITAVPGRLERIPNDRGFLVFVDYAHTDDALSNVLRMLREITRRRLLVVFGCGGDRDRSKRPLMGSAATRLADYAVITSDNPRSEDPSGIVADIVAGCVSNKYEIVLDREAAIARALELAREGDTILIAGKGHENVQEFDHTIVPFDDREVAQRLLQSPPG